MIIKVKVHPNSSEERVEKISESNYNVYLTEKAEKNKANIALIRIFSKLFNVSHRKIKIRGLTSREKSIEIEK